MTRELAGELLDVERVEGLREDRSERTADAEPQHEDRDQGNERCSSEPVRVVDEVTVPHTSTMPRKTALPQRNRSHLIRTSHRNPTTGGRPVSCRASGGEPWGTTGGRRPSTGEVGNGV